MGHSQRRRDIPQAEVERVLAEMKATLGGSDLWAKRALLMKLVAWAELGKAEGMVALTFPLQSADLLQYPRGVRTTGPHSALSFSL